MQDVVDTRIFQTKVMEEYKRQFMINQLTALFHHSGFKKYYCTLHYTQLDNGMIHSLIMETDSITDIYINDKTDEVCGNLSACLTSTHSTIWNINAWANKVFIYENASAKLIHEIQPLMPLPNNLTHATGKMIIEAMAVSQFFIEKVIYTLPGNWLLKRWNKTPQNLVLIFLCWLTTKAIHEKSSASLHLNTFFRVFGCQDYHNILIKQTDQNIERGCKI